MTEFDRLFITALEDNDLKSLGQVPKADLHNHCCLGGHRDYIQKRSGIVMPPLSSKLYSMDEMQQWINLHLGGLLDDPERRAIPIEACFEQARRDGVTVLETGEDVWANGQYYQGNIDALIEEYEKVHREIAPGVDFRFQVGLSRHCPIDLLQEWITPFLERDCFFSLDLYCDEMAQPIRNFKPIYRRAKDKGLLLKAHVGEWGDADSVWEAVEELELNEVQHGIAAAESVRVMNRLADHGIQLNICPTSNVMLNRVADLKHHPIRTLYDHGVKVTVNSDDILVFGQSVSQEFLNLFSAGVFNAVELNEIRRNGLASRTANSQSANI